MARECLFFHTQDELQTIADKVLIQSKEFGATDAIVEVSESSGLSVLVRCDEVSTIERHHEKSICLTVFIGKCCGSASTSDFSLSALRDTASAACNIARFTSVDTFSGLAEKELLETSPRDLKLFYPWELDVKTAVTLAKRAERAAFETDSHIVNSEGTSVATQHSHFILANSHGFVGGFPASYHSITCIPIASINEKMQRDSWYSVERNPISLISPENIGKYAAQRTLARLGARPISTRKCAVLLEAPIAAELVTSFTEAISGGALYRNTTFLADSLGKKIFPDHINITENPHEIGGLGSTPFDAEGVRTRPRKIVSKGVIEGYFLSTYSARKLGMVTTGNAGGIHNLHFESILTAPSDDLEVMLHKLHTGLFVTDLMGYGVNLVNGDYSRGASGYWVENGRIQYPVEEITVAGNLKEIFASIVAVGADTLVRANKKVGSLLIEEMTIGGLNR